MTPALTRESELVPRLTVGEVIDVLNAEDSGFECQLDPTNWTAPPDIKVLSEGKGYCSLVYSIRFHTPEGIKAVVAKVPTADIFTTAESTEEERRESFEVVAGIHQNELTVYEQFKKLPSNDLKVLKFFGGQAWTTEQTGFMLMEDASGRICSKEFTGVVTFSDKLIKEAITEIAKMQAIGFTFPAELRSQLSVSTRTMAQVFAYVENLLVQLEQKKHAFMTPKRLAVLRDGIGMEGHLREATFHETVGLPAVLIHNDFWIANLLLTPEGFLDSIIDWQATKFGNFTHDLSVLLALVLPGEERRSREDGYLQFYLDQLRLQLAKYGVQDAGGLENVSLDTTKKVYRTTLRYAARVNVLSTMTNYDARNPGVNGQESPLVSRFRCCMEDLTA